MFQRIAIAAVLTGRSGPFAANQPRASAAPMGITAPSQGLFCATNLP